MASERSGAAGQNPWRQHRLHRKGPIDIEKCKLGKGAIWNWTEPTLTATAPEKFLDIYVYFFVKLKKKFFSFPFFSFNFFSFIFFETSLLLLYYSSTFIFIYFYDFFQLEKNICFSFFFFYFFFFFFFFFLFFSFIFLVFLSYFLLKSCNTPLLFLNFHFRLTITL